MSQKIVPFSLEYLPLHIQLECRDTAQLPAYLGSTLHGVVGWALSANSKIYSYLFENRKFGGAKQDIINPYIIEPPRHQAMYLQGDILSFKLILLGNAVNYAAEVVEALVRSRQFGIGANRKVFRLVSIMQGECYRPIWREDLFKLEAAKREVLAESEQGDCSRCSIQLLTPLRIRRGGELLLKVDFTTVIRNITRRLDMLTERYGGYVDAESMASVLEQAANVVERAADLYVAQINRYSSRRDEKMDMSGLLGVLTYEGELSSFTPWLNAARKLHIGRNTTFGYGQIEVIFG